MLEDRPVCQLRRSSYFPYGEERTGTGDGREKFGTYFRDGAGQDYADQRYYTATKGRFWSPDPGGVGTANGSDPGSWNRYGYVQGDPINFQDPGGSNRVVIGGSVIDCFDDADGIYDGSCTGSDGGWGGGGGGVRCGFGYGTDCGFGPGGGCFSGNGFLPVPDPSCSYPAGPEPDRRYPLITPSKIKGNSSGGQCR